MKKTIYQNSYFFIIIFAFLIFTIAYGLYYKYTNIDNIPLNTKLNSMCYDEENENSPLCKTYFENNNNVSVPTDTFTLYHQFTNNTVITYAVLFGVVLISLVVMQRLKEKELFKYYLIRENYHKYKVNMLKKLVPAIFVIAIIFLNVFIVSFLITQNFDYSAVIARNEWTFPENYLQMGLLFFGIIEIATIIFSYTCLLLVLIANWLVNNKYIAMVLSFVLFVILEIFMEGPVYLFFLNYGINSISYFNILDVITFSNINNLGLWFFVRIIVAFILTIVTYLLYKNKEHYVINMEKMGEISK